MYQLHDVRRKCASRVLTAAQGTARFLIRGTGHVLAAALPFALFIGALVLCMFALVPATRDSPVDAKTFLLSHPKNTLNGPGRYIHIKGRMRLAPDAVFTPTADAPLVPVEFWFTENPSMGWCISTPTALAYASKKDSALLIMEPAAGGMIAESLMPISYPQLPFVNYLMWGREFFPVEGNMARCRNYRITSAETKAANRNGNHLLIGIAGTTESVEVEDESKPYSNWFDPRLVKTYVVDAESRDLYEARVTTTINGQEIVLLHTDSITYCPTGVIPESMQRAIDNFVSKMEKVEQLRGT